MIKKTAVFILCIVIAISGVSCKRGDNGGNEDKEVSKYENKYTDYVHTEINQDSITWPEGQILPTFPPYADTIDAVNINKMDEVDRAMWTALCGIINRKQPRIMVYTTNENTEDWSEEIGIKLEITKDYEGIIQKYKDEIKGLIVWDEEVPETINLATTVAGFKDAMIVNEEQLAIYSAEPYNFTVLEDYRGKFSDRMDVYEYIYEEIWPDCTHRLIAGIKAGFENGNISVGWEIRDLIAGANLVVLWLDPTVSEEKVLLAKFLADCEPGKSYYIGWWTSEGDGVGLGSDYGVATIPADYYYNYSLYSSTSRELNIPTIPAKPELENKFYIAFTISDGDNLQYVQHHMKGSTKMWASKRRGTYPISWTCSSALLDAGPQLLNCFYKTATDNDCIISGPSGLGYCYPLQFGSMIGQEDLSLDNYTKLTDSYFRRTGFSVITVWNFIQQAQAAYYAKNVRSLTGFTVQERYTGQPAQEIIDNRLPLITTSPRYDGDADRVLDIIKDAVDAWDGNSPAFMMPQLISWSCGVPEVIKIATALEKEYGDKVEFVRADHLLMLYSESENIPYNITLRAQNVTDSGHDGDFDPLKAFDGSFTDPNGWKSSAEGEKWITVDLQAEYEISRYVLKNAGAAYYSQDLNTKGFKIQASTDGNSWSDIDEVTANKSDIVDKDVDKFTARYVRVLITNPGSDGVARIQEFELYGVKK